MRISNKRKSCVFLTNHMKYFYIEVSVNAVKERNSYIMYFGGGMVCISNLWPLVGITYELSFGSHLHYHFSNRFLPKRSTHKAYWATDSFSSIHLTTSRYCIFFLQKIHLCQTCPFTKPPPSHPKSKFTYLLGCITSFPPGCQGKWKSVSGSTRVDPEFLSLNSRSLTQRAACC